LVLLGAATKAEFGTAGETAEGISWKARVLLTLGDGSNSQKKGLKTKTRSE
jgi:hypothetical protein